MPTLIALLALVASNALAVPAPAAAASATPSIPFQQFTLPNGLHVILSEDHTAPLVGVEVAYDVGSKDEKPGRTGFAHLFEHLMFQGTEHLPKGEADRLIEAAGGYLQRVHQRRPDPVLGTGPVERAGADALHPVGAHGAPAPHARPGQARQPARGGPERAARELRDEALRARLEGPAREPLEPRVPLPLADHRLARGPASGLARGREGVLPSLVRPGQRVARHRRRHRPGEDPRPGGEVLRRDPPRRPPAPGGGAPGAAHRREAGHPPGRRPAPPPVPGLADAEGLRGRRRRARPARGHPRQRQVQPAPEAPGDGRSHRPERDGRSAVAGPGRHVPRHRHPQARERGSTGSPPSSTRRSPGSPGTAPPRRSCSGPRTGSRRR